MSLTPPEADGASDAVAAVPSDVVILLGNTAAIQKDSKYPDLNLDSMSLQQTIIDEIAAGAIAEALDPNPEVDFERASDEVLLARLKALKVSTPLVGNQVTKIVLPYHADLDILLRELAPHLPYHTDDSRSAFAWVTSNDSLVEQTLARRFDCPIGVPKDWSV